MQPDQMNISGNDAHSEYELNHAMLMSVLTERENSIMADAGERTFTISIERVLYDHTTRTMVRFDGQSGIEAMLGELVSLYPGCVEEWHDGHLMGLSTAASKHLVGCPMIVELGPGGQVICKVGPSQSVVEMLDALQGFDRAVHVASRNLGCDYALLSEGYNSFVDTPLDVPLVPRTKWTLMSAYLSQTGRYARDAMRCACAMHLSLDFSSERDGLAIYRLGTALTPLLMFLTDNVRSFRGSGARRCPNMTRAIIWEEVDPKRCGIVPGTFDSAFSFDRYVEWLEGLSPILATTEDDEVSSTGKRTLRQVMEAGPFSTSQTLHAFDIALPFVRLGESIEFLQIDALRPRMAASICAFVKGLFCDARSVDAVWSMLSFVKESDVQDALFELRLRGWNAPVYGQRVTDLVAKLVGISRAGLQDPTERRLLDEMTELWDFSMVPRDAFIHQEVKANRGW